jgi:alkaline phosphatase
MLLILLAVASVSARGKEVKNVILMIPDGTSWASVSSARWFLSYNNNQLTKLNIDPYICGSILTFCSNAPIGDSAPTTSCYVTGYPSISGWVSTYPVADAKNDIVPMDSTKAYQPMTTVLEAARMTQNKATGLVFTCEFPHATPADCSAHSYRRGKYEWIAPQMVHNKIDVVLGGGIDFLRDEDKTYLKNEGYGLFLKDINGFRNYQGDKMWALFADKDMAYDVDRDPVQEPSLAEMTEVAINKLSKNKNGFFLMVEGSKVDWAAHANDPRAIISDMLAFDKACGVAIDYAKKVGNTVVVIVPDHGNSGISLGCSRCANYSFLTKDQLFANVNQYKTSADGLIKALHETKPENIRSKVLELTGIALTDDQYQQLLKCGDYNLSTLTDEQRMKGSTLTETVTDILVNNTCFGFTTHGHTGEEVFLAVYDPRPNRLMGHHTNIELNHYLRNSLGLKKDILETLTDNNFARHSEVFAGLDYTMNKDGKEPLLTVKGANNAVLEVRPYTNIVKVNGKDVSLNSVIVYVDKNDTFFLPRSLRDYLK